MSQLLQTAQKKIINYAVPVVLAMTLESVGIFFSWRAYINIRIRQGWKSPTLSYFFLLFRWFKFTLKPPYSGASERSLSAIWDTSHWNFFVKFGLRTAWDISYDILLSLLKFINFWRLQGRLSILAKIGCLQKIKVFSMKERRGFDATWGF